jgi:cytochrome b561
MFYNTPSHYGAVSKLLHWSNAALMLPMIVIGYYMTMLSDEDPLYFRLLDLHQVVGVLIFCLFALKSVWRFVSPNPDLSLVSRGTELWLARIVHAVLFLSMAVIPILGYFFATAQGDGVPIYDLFEIPGVIELHKAQADMVIDLHAVLAYTIAGVIMLHIYAALKHRFIDKPAVGNRMWFRT